MKAMICILAILFCITSGIEGWAEDNRPTDAQNPYYLVDGLKYSAEGNCEKAINSYKAAWALRQFKEEWIYYLAVADCFTALKRFDEAIEAYTKVIAGVQNRTLQGEMYKGRARAYYLKSLGPDSVDPKIIGLARKDLDSAMGLGADISDLAKNISEDTEAKPAWVDKEEGKTVIADKAVTVVEAPTKLVAGEGEYIVYISADTRINDQKGMAISASDIKAGDIIDFSYTMSYINKSDGMTHLSANTVTLHRDIAPKTASIEEKAPNSTEMLILSQLTSMVAEINDLKMKQSTAFKEAAVKTVKKPNIRKHHRKKKKAEEDKAKPVKTNPAALP